MLHPQAVTKLFDYNIRLLNKQTERLTHADSLVQPNFDGNSINWIIGHLISSRTHALMRVGEQPVWDDDTRARYRHRSAPISDDEPGVLPLETLLRDINESQRRLVAGLSQMTYDQMCQPSGYEDKTIGDSLAYFQFHEAHHVGQVVYIAPLVGQPGVWIS